MTQETLYMNADGVWIDLTIAFIKVAHHNQTDKSGAPYYLHPIRVMENLGPDATLHEKLTALLHDVIEDTHITLLHLQQAGYHQEVIDAVNLLTRRRGTTYSHYIQRLIESRNSIAIKVKLADLKDNTDLSRPLTVNIGSLAERYAKAKAMLEAVL